MTDRVPDLLVEQLALDELSATDAKRVRSRLGTDADARVAELRSSNAALLDAHPPEDIARRIEQRLQQLDARADTDRPNPWQMWLFGGAIAAAATAVLAWTLTGSDEITPPSEQNDVVAIASPPPDAVRLKGDAAIVLRKRVGSRSVVMSVGDAVSAGDEILVSYRAAGARHGVLVSLDGAGEVTLHFPQTRESSTKLKPAGAIPLHTFELDDAPAYERFFFVTGASTIDVGQVVEQVRTLGSAADAATATLRVGDPALAVVEFPLRRVEAP